MICKRCDIRFELYDCSDEELKYNLCEQCIQELKENGDLE